MTRSCSTPRGGAVVPGFVDPHTHVVFAGDRRDELRRRLGGATYAEIAAGGGGIVSSVAATRAASAETLEADTRVRLDEMLRCGTTTCEAKSGYALDHGRRAENAADGARARGETTRSSCRRRSWARTRFRSSTATAGARTCDLDRRRDDSRASRASASPNGATSSARPACSRPPSRARSSRPAAPPGCSRASTPTSSRRAADRRSPRECGRDRRII